MTPPETPPFSRSVHTPMTGRSGSFRRTGPAIAAALRRQRMTRRSLTARLMGDPPDGRSALAAERRGGTPAIALSEPGTQSVLARTPDHFEPVEHDDGAPLDLAGLPVCMTVCMSD